MTQEIGYDDGLDWLRRIYFPLAAQGANASNAADYEELGYDAAGNDTSRRHRAGETAGNTFDALNRLTFKDLPGSEPDVTYGYDLLGRMTSASQAGHALSFTHDALGRRLSETGPLGTVASQYDLAGRRTRLTYPGGTYFVDYDHLLTGEVSAIRENGATSGVGVIATYGYDDRGRRTSLTRGNGTSTSYAYDAASRLQSLSLDFPGTAADQALTFTYNPAAQIIARTGSNDAYAPTGLANASTTATPNGRNQLTALTGTGAATLTYDARGNLIGDGTVTYGYSSENLLTSLASPSQTIAFSYDPLMRLAVEDSTIASLDASLGYDGPNIVHEALSGGRVRRYVFGPGADEVLYSVLLNPSAATIYYWHHQDERGSIVRLSDELGDAYGAARFDEYGIGGGAGRFRFTGQFWLGEGGLHLFLARVYHPGLGRFLQTDPIGYGDGMNLYAYVRGDPVNRRDPSGLCATLWGTFKATKDHNSGETSEVLLYTERDYSACSGLFDSVGGGHEARHGGGEAGGSGPIVVTGSRPLRREFELPQRNSLGRPAVLIEGFGAGDGAGTRLLAVQGTLPSLSRRECAALVWGIVAAGAYELVGLAVHAIRAASIAELFILGTSAAATARFIVVGVAAGGTVYIVDRITGGRFSSTVGHITGVCR